MKRKEERVFANVAGKSRTQQHEREKNDLNMLADKHQKSAMMQRMQHGDPNGRQPQFVFIPSQTFHEQMNVIMDVQNHFNRLPARVRTKFHNSPEQMLRFVENEANYKEAVKMGLIPPQEAMEAKLRQEAEQVDLVDESGLEGHGNPQDEENAGKADPEANPRPSAPVTKKGVSKAR